MTPYTSNGTPKLFELTLDTTITQGSFVAVLGNDEDKSYHVAEVLSVVNEQVNVHYWVPPQRSWKQQSGAHSGQYQGLTG